MARAIVLVTRLSGLIGSALRHHLDESAYEVRGLLSWQPLDRPENHH